MSSSGRDSKTTRDSMSGRIRLQQLGGIMFFKKSNAPTKSQEVFHRPTSNIMGSLYIMYMSASLTVSGKQKESDVDYCLHKIYEGANQYVSACEYVQRTTGKKIPWQVLAVLHGLEASYDFNRQILNGERINSKTTLIPKGLGPWDSWAGSVVTAAQRMDIPEDWSIANTLYFIEKHNGMGYRKYGIASPYVWAYTQHYKAGKFVKDGVFDKLTISRQVGAAILLKKISYGLIMGSK